MRKHITRFCAWIIAVFTVISCMANLFTLTVSATDLAEYEQKNYLKNGPSPMDAEPTVVKLSETDKVAENKSYTLSLDGKWTMTYLGKNTDVKDSSLWSKSYDATVPGSIWTDLVAADVIDDPYTGKNMVKANTLSNKHFYYKRTFTYEGSGKNVRLNFDGVCNVCDIYLNGKQIASHEGMFGGPYVDITDTVKQGENTLIVHLAPAKDYTKTVVFNCSYGWHYAKLYPLGIWQSVSITDEPTVDIDSPFISTYDYKNGTVDMSIDLVNNTSSALNGKLTVTVTPKNFTGKSYSYTTTVNAGKVDSTNVRLRCDIPNFKLWWPNGFGEQNLYTLTVSFAHDGGSTDVTDTQFGIRQLEFEPFPNGESAGVYNRTIVINGRAVFMKGAGWCTIDAQMRFTREDYDRILSRTYAAGINYLRSWGGGLVETDEFYDLCDEYGICVYQEWPCCWDSTKTQPADVLYETVTLNAKRLRNRASLVVWGGGNEGEAPFSDTVMNNIGKLTYELDGTRDFWRQDGGVASAGISHDHIHWSGESPEHYIQTYANYKYINQHEYGLDAMMNLDSIRKFIQSDSDLEYPIDAKGTVAYHTSTFNGTTGWTPTPYGYDIDTFIHYASMFTEVNTLEDLIIGSQLAQAQADYLPAQNARMKFPYTTSNAVYKLNDVAPHSTWAIIDWYGAPKISYYMMQDAYRSLMAAPKLDRYNTIASDGKSEAIDIPIYVLDDMDELKSAASWTVTVTAFDENLDVVKTQDFTGKGTVDNLKQVGTFSLTSSQTAHTPLILTVDLKVGSNDPIRSYVYMNFEDEQGCLFYLPKTELEYSVSGNSVTVKNVGSKPALSVSFDVQDTAEFVCSDDYFILMPGESVDITVNNAELINTVTCFNLANTADKVPPTRPTDTEVKDITSTSATLTWTASTDDVAMYGYNIYLNGELYDFVKNGKTSYTLTGLAEVTQYHVTVCAVDNNGNLSAKGRGYTFTTAAEVNAPKLVNAIFGEGGDIILTFDSVMNKQSAESVICYSLSGNAKVISATLSQDGYYVTLKTEGIKSGEAYTVAVVGVQDCKYLGNRVEYTELLLDSGLYLSVDFEQNEQGVAYSSGSITKRINLQSGAQYMSKGHSGAGMTISGNGSAYLENVDYTFKNGCSISLWYSGNASANGYSILFAKGPKAEGHFEVYAQNGNLKLYAPEIGDMDLKTSMNVGSGWHKLVFTYENDTLTTYLDGKKKSEVKLNGSISEITETLSFGALNDNTLAYTGVLDDICLYTRVLSADEIANMGTSHGLNVSGDQYINIDKTILTLKKGEETAIGEKTSVGLKYNVSVLSDGGNPVSVENGKIKALEAGFAVIKLTSEDGSLTALMAVEVTDGDGKQLPDTTPVADKELEHDPLDDIKEETTTVADTEESTTVAEVETQIDINTETQDETQTEAVTEKTKSKGCKGSVGAFGFVSIVSFAAVMVCKKNKEKR